MRKLYTTISVMTLILLAGVFYISEDAMAACVGKECRCPAGTVEIEGDDKSRPIGSSTTNWCEQKVEKVGKTYHCYVEKTTTIGSTTTTSWVDVGDTGEKTKSNAKKECKKMNKAKCKMQKSCKIHKDALSLSSQSVNH
jgi:hypothetical protein